MLGPRDEEAFDDWKKKMCTKNPTFKYWDIILSLEILVLIFVRFHRERNFSLFIDVLETLIPSLDSCAYQGHENPTRRYQR